MSIFGRLFGRDEFLKDPPGTQYAILVTWKGRERKGSCWGGNQHPWLTTSLEKVKSEKIACEAQSGKECKYEIMRWNGPESIPEAARTPDRQWAKRLSDEGVSCAMAGNHAGARRKWLDAADSDETWSVPSFNLAKSYIDQGDFGLAEQFLDEAESRAAKGSSSEDSQVLEQVNTIRARIMIKKVLHSRRRGR